MLIQGQGGFEELNSINCRAVPNFPFNDNGTHTLDVFQILFESFYLK